MSLNVVALSNEVYDSLLKDFIKCVEGEKLPVYLDTKKTRVPHRARRSLRSPR
jgi:hypothetical protein